MWHSLHIQPKMTDLSVSHAIVAAIDFGTTYSGYAFSSANDFLRDPLKIFTHTWSGDLLETFKAPTCVLFDPEKRFSNFGYEAEDKYTSLASGDEPDQDHRTWFFFRQFKMTLYDKMNLQRQYMLKDETGKEMPALDVFSAAIGYLKNHLIKECRKSFTSIDVNSDIRWVLTVPAIWTDACKQFMREAANMAGIKNDKLLIALEPEAASICCRHLPLHSVGNDVKRSMFEPFSTGSKYMVLDAGGGTVDITVHEVEESGELRELYVANGGNWGGIKVDQAFRHFISSIVGKDIIDHLQINNMDDYISLFRHLEIKKRTCRKNYKGTIKISVPIKLSELFEEKTKENINEFVAAKFKLQGQISWMKDKLKIDGQTAEGFFNGACQSILEHLEALFSSKQLDDVPTILMVGGFSESLILQEIIKNRFKDKRIIIPTDPSNAVLKGAVIFGHNPKVIAERCCRKTYGIQTSLPFREGKDPEKYKFTDDNGKELCSNRFDKHVGIFQAVRVGKCLLPQSYQPTKANQKQLELLFFASNKLSPEYTHDPHCESVGSLNIDLEGFGMDRSVEVKMIFGWTEVEVVATDKKSGRQVKTALNFLG